VFLDLGCGLGWVVLEAGVRYPFRRVIGVDVVPAFTEVARQTIAVNRPRLRCGEVELVTADATGYEVPDDVTVVYPFHPVYGEAFDAVVSNLIASVDRTPRRLRVIRGPP
jgi:SAM-dependent methyltransferase